MQEAPSFKNNLSSTDTCYHIEVLRVTITANLCLVVIMLRTVWCPHTSMYFKTHPTMSSWWSGMEIDLLGHHDTHTSLSRDLFIYFIYFQGSYDFSPSFSKQKCMFITNKAVYFFHLHFTSLLTLKIQSTHCMGRMRVNSFSRIFFS